MELSDLEVFRCVVDTGGITKAAERLHRVPSNVTTRVRQLEDDLGVELFIREGRRLRISPAGELLRGYANDLLNLAQKAREALKDSTPRGTLRIGAMESTAATRLSQPLAEYHRTYPEVSLILQTGTTKRLLQQVLLGELDAALVADPIADTRLSYLPVFEEELVLIAEAAHPRLRTAADARKHSALVFGAGCAYRERLESWFEQGNVLPSRIVELSSYHAILGCAVTGMGIAMVPRSVVDLFPGIDELSIHPLPRAARRSRTHMVWRTDTNGSNVNALSSMLIGGPAVS